MTTIYIAGISLVAGIALGATGVLGWLRGKLPWSSKP